MITKIPHQHEDNCCAHDRGVGSGQFEATCLGPMADVDYDALEETLTWGEKFFATSYIQLLFQPVNLLLVVFFLLAMFFGKIMFATPYFVLNSFYKKKAKKARATQRDEARKLKVQRKLQRESLRRRNSAGSKSTDAAAATGTDAVGAFVVFLRDLRRCF